MHKTEENTQRHQCDNCAKTFKNFDYLKRHQKIIHGFNISKFNCYICGKDYAAIQSLKIHMKNIHKKERVACENK